MKFAFTGHRPHKLGGYSDVVDNRLRYLASTFLTSQPRIELVYSGMALGWDMAVAEAAISLSIPVWAVIPFVGQESRWPDASQARYRSILNFCHSTTIVSDGGYSVQAMQIRNQWMVDRCDRLVALWDGTPGGTSNCVRYASRKEKPIIHLWDQWKALQ